jgi:hypothetical protein
MKLVDGETELRTTGSSKYTAQRNTDNRAARNPFI